jgi:uncharacterized protein (DUF736 family)
MNIGNGWSGTTQDGRACIDLQLDGVFTRIFPWLKDLRFRMTYVSQENRSGDKSPDWTIQTYPKQESNTKASEKTEELVKNAAAATTTEEANAKMAEAEEMSRVAAGYYGN